MLISRAMPYTVQTTHRQQKLRTGTRAKSEALDANVRIVILISYCTLQLREKSLDTDNERAREVWREQGGDI
jgi:hypothetical protein